MHTISAMPCHRILHQRLGGALLALLVIGCAAAEEGSLAPPDYFEGAAYDEQHPNAPLGAGKADGHPLSYQVPTDLPVLEAPEVILSLDALTVHLFDRTTDFSRVYPAGVGVKDSRGESITPTGHFATGDDPSHGWWYVPRRWTPEYFGGFPFLRITAKNSKGYATYGLHGPITQTLIRGYVSHGCVRMAKNDIVEFFYLLRDHASTPITFQKEVERDASGAEVDVGSQVTLWKPGAPIQYGESVGPAPWQAPIIPPPPIAPVSLPDAGVDAMDAASEASAMDSSAADASSTDGATSDASPTDTSPSDVSTTDASSSDASTSDASATDLSTEEDSAAPRDGGPRPDRF